MTPHALRPSLALALPTRETMAPSIETATRAELAIEVLRLRRLLIARDEQVHRARERYEALRIAAVSDPAEPVPLDQRPHGGKCRDCGREREASRAMRHLCIGCAVKYAERQRRYDARKRAASA